MSESVEGDAEHLGQMFVDDSNWFASSAAAMTTMHYKPSHLLSCILVRSIGLAILVACEWLRSSRA